MLVPGFFLRISDLFDSQPVGEVSSVGQRGGQAHDSDGLRCVGGDEVGPGHDDLQHRTSVLTCEQDMRVQCNQTIIMFKCLHTAVGFLI